MDDLKYLGLITHTTDLILPKKLIQKAQHIKLALGIQQRIEALIRFMAIIELLDKLIIDDRLDIELAQLVEQDSPGIMGDALEFVLLDDVLLMEHVQ